jgi:hypothetical protein
VQLTVSEVRKLLRRLVLARRPPPREEVLRWSAWRRNHQAVARLATTSDEACCWHELQL